MKKLLFIICFVLMVSVTGAYAAPAGSGQSDTQSYTAIVPSMAAIAEWVEDFVASYNENGIYQAVAEVFDDGHTPLEITVNALKVEGLNPQGLVAALYCAGAKHDDIRMASEESGISEIILVAGFETAKTVCGDNLQDTQAYTPVGLSFSIPGGNGGGTVYGSPDGFTN